MRALKDLAEEATKAGRPLPKALRRVVADVLRSTTPLDQRHLAAGDHQRRQQDMLPLPLSVTAHLMVEEARRRPDLPLSSVAMQACAMGAQKVHPKPVCPNSYAPAYDHPCCPSQETFWRQWVALAKWIVASGSSAVQVMEVLEARLGQERPLKADNFRFLRGLHTDQWRRALAANALATGCDRLPQLANLSRQVEKTGWCEWHWSAENLLLNPLNSMHVLGCSGTPVPMTCFFHCCQQALPMCSLQQWVGSLNSYAPAYDFP